MLTGALIAIIAQWPTDEVWEFPIGSNSGLVTLVLAFYKNVGFSPYPIIWINWVPILSILLNQQNQ